MPKFFIAAAFAGLAFVHAGAQTALAPDVADDAPTAATCSTGAPLSGTVRDTTQALIPGATLSLDGATITSGSDGRFRFICIAAGQHQLSVSASGFASSTLTLNMPHAAALNITLAPAEVQTNIDVPSENTAASNSATSVGATQTISGDRLQSLADDPDDLMRELQQLASSAGGSASTATIAVDGFEPGESGAHLPPKSSIAYIKVNPDLFSSEYRDPPFSGGRIEIYTKPGLPTFHGALFLANSSSWMNARDPFSNAPSSIGKQRYGFELTGPIFKHSDFTTTLEHRYVNNFTVVNAITVNTAGVESPLVQTVPTPQNLWSGLAKTEWQLGPKNTFIVSLDTFNSDTLNNGVGGSSLLETGYEFHRYDENLHITNVTTITPKIMHEARLAFEWDGYSYTPNSLAPQVSVAGAFTKGGSTLGDAHEAGIQTSIIDDVIIQTKAHLFKVGLQFDSPRIHTYNKSSFNGSYLFGGTVTSTGAVVTGIQQYVNALNGAPNGSPTQYSNVAGNPQIDIVQIRNALYFEDEWKALKNLHVAYGLRWYAQNKPTMLNTLQPRIGVSWSPDKKSTWNLHAHAGMFSGRMNGHAWETIVFSDGVQRTTNLVYSPTCAGAFDPSTCNPLASGNALQSVRTVSPNFKPFYYAIENVGVTKTFPAGWTLTVDHHQGQIWHFTRTENINSPLNGQPTGPRPLAPNRNILELQSSGRGWAAVDVFSLAQQKNKYIQFNIGAAYEGVFDDTENNPFSTPQTTGVNAGEYARRSGVPLWNVFGNATVHLPGKLVLSPNLNAGVATPYNVTTGFDNNGDGDFNDRAQFAPAGTPLCSANPNAVPCGYNTQWGELVSSGGIGSLPRNVGTMPWTVYLDSNLQRVFKLTKNPKAEHQQTLTANIRSSNVLNHLNTTAVGSVLGSPLFGVPYAADNGRRVEGGLRYSF